jgi:hypothetical protein
MAAKKPSTGRVTPKGNRPSTTSARTPHRPLDGAPPRRLVVDRGRPVPAKPFVGRPISARAGHRGGR